MERHGLERDEFDAVLALLPDYLRPLVRTAHITGWRVRSELLTRERRHVDFQAGWLRPDPGETRNGEGRMLPLTPELRAALERTRAFEAKTGRVVPWLLHRNGQPIKGFRKAWRRACAEAGHGRAAPGARPRVAPHMRRGGCPGSSTP